MQGPYWPSTRSDRAGDSSRSEQDATSNVGTVTRISRSPFSCARTIAEERHRGWDNTAKDDCCSNKFEQFGKLINKGMGLLGQHANTLSMTATAVTFGRDGLA
jgi:hypothetical protein